MTCTTGPPAPVSLLLGRRFGGMGEGIQGWPVGVGNRPQRIVGVGFIPQHQVALPGEPKIHGWPRAHPQVASLKSLPAYILRVVLLDRKWLPLSTDDVAQDPARDIGVVAPRSMPGPRRNSGGAVNDSRPPGASRPETRSSTPGSSKLLRGGSSVHTPWISQRVRSGCDRFQPRRAR